MGASIMVQPQILELAPPPSNKRPSCRPKFKISARYGRVMRQQRMYSFRRGVLDLYNISGCEHVKF